MNDPHSQQKEPAHWAMKEVDHLLSRFARYTRFVFVSKWFLMILAIGLLTTLIGLPLLSKSRAGMRVSFVDSQEARKNQTAEPVMNSPEYYGTTDKGDQYKITGEKAIQVNPTLIRVIKVDGQMMSVSGGWRALVAKTGEYQQDKKIMTLIGDVSVTDDKGYNFVTQSAVINTNTSEVTGSEPVQGSGPLGNLLASSFRIMDNGSRIIFYTGATPLRVTIQRSHGTKRNAS